MLGFYVCCLVYKENKHFQSFTFARVNSQFSGVQPFQEPTVDLTSGYVALAPGAVCARIICDAVQMSWSLASMLGTKLWGSGSGLVACFKRTGCSLKKSIIRKQQGVTFLEFVNLSMNKHI